MHWSTPRRNYRKRDGSDWSPGLGRWGAVCCWNRQSYDLLYRYADKDITLTPGINNKVPDGHWVIEANQIPPNLVNQFPLNPRTGRIAPQLVLEVAVANESMPRLTQIDLPRYFAAGTGTRAWIGIKIFKDDRNTPPVHRWWCGWATRDYLNGQFLNSATMHRESMPILTNNNAPISTPTNITFHIDVDLLLHPMPRPQGYPATLDIDMERVRRRANSEL